MLRIAVALSAMVALQSEAQVSVVPRPNNRIDPLSFCSPVRLSFSDGTPVNLSGVWSGDDQGLYYLRQIDDCVYWAGLDKDPGLRFGIAFTNVFKGRLSPDLKLSGSWADVPRGDSSGSGALVLQVSTRSTGEQTVVEINKTSEIGSHFGASHWTRTVPVFPFSGECDYRDIVCKFNHFKKNGGDSLLDELEPYKDNVVVAGVVATPAGNNFPAGGTRTYCSFFRVRDPDGDTDFNIGFDYFGQPPWSTFWTDDGWLHLRQDIVDKMAFQVRQGTFPPHLKGELVMFARTTKPLTPSAIDCPADSQPLLPGWMESGANSVLINGRPLDGQLPSGDVATILGQQLPVGTKLRVTGTLALDCGHAEVFDTRPCHPDDVDCGDHCQNSEIHPVHAIDVIQNWNLPRPNVNLTGAWAATDAGTYYVRQIDNVVWWLGLSVDQGVTFANVFRGTVRAGEVSGDWADVPMHDTAFQNRGELALRGAFCFTSPGVAGVTCNDSESLPNHNYLTTAFTNNAVFRGYSWEKLYDSPAPQYTVTVSFLSVKFEDMIDADRLARFRLTFDVNGQRFGFPVSLGAQNLALGTLFTLPQSTRITLPVITSDLLKISVSAKDDNKLPCTPAAGQPCSRMQAQDFYDVNSNFGAGISHQATSRISDGESFQITYRVDLR
jgi:hypothetical protein